MDDWLHIVVVDLRLNSKDVTKSEKLECFMKRYVRFLERTIKGNEVMWEWYIRRLGMI